MNGKRVLTVILTVVIAFGLAFSVMADDSIVFRRNISKTPDGETEKSGLSMMYFYVPAQAADGTLLPEGGLEYYAGIEDEDGNITSSELVDTRSFAKPLTAVYIDEEYLVDEETETAGDSSVMTGIAFGTFDAFGALSLDDGETWKTYNLSRSADLSSFTLADGHEYPGAVHVAVQATAKDRIMIAWISRYCDGGNPNYINSIDKDKNGQVDDTTMIDYLQGSYELPDLYVRDVFGVQGTQQSVDYALQGYPEVGEIPYGCVWAARGQLVPAYDETGVLTGGYDLLWTKPERLTSGKRDPNKLEIDARPGGGFILTWQEDPEGLRPGKGLGPGEGWSGAIVNSRTDLWYSYISWDNFGLLNIDEDGDDDATNNDVVAMEDYLALYPDGTMPKVEVPMAMPVRLTDNNTCRDLKSDAYCYMDFDETDPYGLTEVPDLLPMAFSSIGTADYCTETLAWTTPGGSILNICKAEDGRYLRGRVGASRPRVGLYPISGLNESGETVTRYFVVMAYEETKALGDGISDEEVDPVDIGKNLWYHSFDMFHPDLVAQGGMLNQPAIDYTDGSLTYGEFFPLQLDTWSGYEFYETEIARRFSLVAQPYSNIGDSRTTAFLIYKQGIINQGGPADVFARRIVLPDDFAPAVDNPYDFKYTCDDWAFANGENPMYLQGVCLTPAINFSGNTIVACDSIVGDCAADFPWDGLEDGDKWPKVTEWLQTADNLDDQSWANPYDVSKGHRGFLDGDFLMVMYAYAPNWKANSVGNDHFNLYVRRSFDGGLTFTTTPAALRGVGITTCENYGQGSTVYEACFDYAAGEFEQARNVSQLVGNKVTVLDPRYSPTGGMKQMVVTNLLGVGGAGELPYADDAVRDPSRFFVIFETGDNTTMDTIGATPLDLFYSRASVYGDVYDDVYLSDVDKDGNGEIDDWIWDWVENQKDDLSGEAGVTVSPGGNFMYTVWNQWQEAEQGVITNSDIIFRRFFYNDRLDTLPTASIFSDIPTLMILGDTLDLVGAGRDWDRMGDGVVSYKWMIVKKGGELQVHNGQNLSIKTEDLGVGDFTVTFSVLDDEGNWSYPVTFEFSIWADYFEMHIPLVRR